MGVLDARIESITQNKKKEDPLKGVRAELGKLEKAISNIKFPTPKDNAQDFVALGMHINSIKSAIERIEIPAPVVNVEKPDLGPVIKAIQSIPQPNIPVVENSPREWVFHVKRSIDGFIQEIVAEAR